MKKLFKNKNFLGDLFFIIFLMVPLVSFAASVDLNDIKYTLLAPLPFIETTPGSGIASAASYIKNMVQLIIALAGALAVIRIIIGGFQYLAADGFGGKSNAKEVIQNSLLGLLLAIGAFTILNTLNPSLVTLNLDLETIPPPVVTPVTGGTASTTGVLLCAADTWSQLAAKNSEPYPATNSPELNTLISCIESNLPGRNFGSIATFDQSNPVCNYTRGARTCSTTCSHAINSCHYGGRSGTTGARAVDFGNELIGRDIVNVAVNKCGAKSARCEDGAGNNVGCAPGSGANHVHVNTGSCDAN